MGNEWTVCTAVDQSSGSRFRHLLPQGRQTNLRIRCENMATPGLVRRTIAISSAGTLLASTIYGMDSVVVNDIGTGKRLTELTVDGVSAIAFLNGTDNLVVGAGPSNPLSVWRVTNNA